jgi:putative toxin-antitoxin system antitoxin component (TIGR02293 family)
MPDSSPTTPPSTGVGSKGEGADESPHALRAAHTAKRKVVFVSGDGRTKREGSYLTKSEFLPTALSYGNVFRATQLERIGMIRRGVPASEAKRIFGELSIGQAVGFKALNLSVATVNKKAKQGETLSPEDSERVVGFAKLVGQMEAMVQESGDPTNFDARAWLARWLTEPLPAFGGIRPADLIDTMEGQSMVSVALAQIESGAYV